MYDELGLLVYPLIEEHYYKQSEASLSLFYETNGSPFKPLK